MPINSAEPRPPRIPPEHIAETLRRLEEAFGPGVPLIRPTENGFNVEWRRAANLPTAWRDAAPPCREEAMLAHFGSSDREWARRNPCHFARLSRRLGPETMRRLARTLRDMERERQVRPARPTVAVCCAVLNEGAELEATVASLLSAALVPDIMSFVDDSSRQPIAPRLSRMLGDGSSCLKVRRNGRRRGVGRSRTLAHQAVGADLYIFIDSHMRFPPDWLERLLEHHADFPRAIIGTVSVGTERPNHFYGCGCVFEPDAGGAFVRATWAPRDRIPMGLCPAMPCLMGACYAVPAAILRDIGGWCPLNQGYGYDEESVCLRAQAMGYEVRVAKDIDVAHRYSKSGEAIDRGPETGSAEEPWEVPFNKAITAHMVFPKRAAAITAKLRDSLTAAALECFDERWRRCAPALAVLSRRFQAKRVVDEESLIAGLNLTLPAGADAT